MAHEGKKILIVDDDKFLLDMYSVKFREKGYEVEVAYGGQEALDKLSAGLNPAVILLDVVMPTISGLDVLKKIREGTLAKDAVIIVLSNQGQQSDVDAAKDFGIDGYIVKASTIPSEVLERVQEILQKKQ
ncbi:MAG: response regulator [Patescibacteria group bacterium]